MGGDEKIKSLSASSLGSPLELINETSEREAKEEEEEKKKKKKKKNGKARMSTLPDGGCANMMTTEISIILIMRLARHRGRNQLRHVLVAYPRFQAAGFVSVMLMAISSTSMQSLANLRGRSQTIN